jgi:thiol-disulfide isomerase/thioredoxin
VVVYYFYSDTCPHCIEAKPFVAGLDAFNPCAFFVLLFLLSLMIHARSRARMMLVGSGGVSRPPTARILPGARLLLQPGG